MPQPTAREPLCDIQAQALALKDCAHPKDTMWISWGTPRPDFSNFPRVSEFDCHGGTFYTTDPAKAQFFELMPTEAGLAACLGHIRRKDEIGVSDDPLVVQATDLDGRVISESMCRRADVPAVVGQLSRHGKITVLTVEAALLRRAVLVRLEG